VLEMNREEFRKIQRHNRAVAIALLIVTLLTIVGIALNYFSKPNTVTKNYIGQKGDKGDSTIGIQGLQGDRGSAGYTPIKGIDYSDGKDGLKGEPGPIGPQGIQGVQGVQGDQGTTGATGQDGKTPEFRCFDGDFQWRYVGDEDWQTLMDKSKAC